MQAIPFQINDETFSVLVVFEQDNIDRMKAYDPIEFLVYKLGEPWASLKLKAVVFGWASPADIISIADMAVSKRPLVDVLKYLSRGFAFRPDPQGDTDEPFYKSAV